MPTFPIPDSLRPVLAAIQSAGGHPFVVGGAVRDWLLGLEPKDLDVEVYGLAPDTLESALAGFRVDAVGRAFGVLKVTIEGDTFDVSLPRRDSKAGAGHRGFVVRPDAHMSYAEGAARRDFTINSLGWDTQHDCLVDPHGGRADLDAKVLRHISSAFAEDPLRVLRGCQFAARFGFALAPDTVELCRSLVSELASLPTERLWVEWQKLLLKSPRPSVGLDALVATGAIELFPELRAMQHVPQDPEWHPEGQDHPLGSLWVHNGMVVDKAVCVLVEDGVTNEDERLILLLGAVCHDLGKPDTTKFEDGRWRANGHEEAGEGPARTFLARIGCPSKILEAVIPLVVHHMKPVLLARAEASPAAVRRLALKVPLTRLCRITRADQWGRGTAKALALEDSRTLAETGWLMQRAAEAKVDVEAPKPLLQGRHLLALGLRPGPELGRALARAFEAQLEGAFVDGDGALDWAREHLVRSTPGQG